VTRVEAECLLRAAFDAAVASAMPDHCLPPFLPEPPPGRTVVLGAGKAAAAMALAVEQRWQAPLEGMVVTPPGHGAPCSRVEVIEAGHPLPTAAGEAAARRMLEIVAGLGQDDLVLCLLSGGGSALVPLPVEGLVLAEKQALTRDLLRCGATIAEINCVRRHLSLIKGGRLAAASHPARVVTLAISDVPGDAPVDIASGPTVADPTSCTDAIEVLDRYRISVPPAVRAGLERGLFESVKPGDPRLIGTRFEIVAFARTALDAAAQAMRSRGLAVRILSDRLEGEAREVGRLLAREARRAATDAARQGAPLVLLSGGETTVTVRGSGKGGRNVECLLGFGLAAAGAPGVFALMADTDGIDGSEPVAGAVWYPDTAARAAALGLDPQDFLERNDAHSFFAALGDSLVSGPTRTNVNDFRAVLVLPESAQQAPGA